MTDRRGESGKKICFVVAAEMTIRAFMIGHLRKLSLENHVTVVVNTGNRDFLKGYGLSVEVFPVGIERRPAPFADLKALYDLYRFFRKEGFDSVHSITPKAGLLAMTSSLLARVPIRIHTFTGQVWATASGVKRLLLKGMDRIIGFCATNVLADSSSQRDFIIQERVVRPEKISVIGHGSICGVDDTRFRPDPVRREKVRKTLGIPEDDIIFLFIGRLTIDKGLLDLATAFSRLCRDKDGTHLLIVGPDEEGVREKMETICSTCSGRIHFCDFTDVPEEFMAASDVFCLPSYREGFGMVVVEAGSAGIPSIGTKIYGITDAIEDNVTGCLYAPGNIIELEEKMRRMIDDRESRLEMGRRARERALNLFSTEHVTGAFRDYYRSLLQAALPGMKS